MGKRIFGLTGVIGSGKSTVAAMFAEMGAKIVDADVLSRHVTSPDYENYPALVDRLETALGEKTLKATGMPLLTPEGINRKALANLVFNDTKSLGQLNEILHPEIHRLFLREVEKADGIIIYDVPLLFENNMHSMFEAVIVVYAHPEICAQRAALRSHQSVSEIKKRMDKQISIEKKKEMADYVIENNSDISVLRSQVRAVWEEINNGN